MQSVPERGTSDSRELAELIKGTGGEAVHLIGVWNGGGEGLERALAYLQADRPVYIGFLSGHQAAVNTALLESLEESPKTERLCKGWMIVRGDSFTELARETYALETETDKRRALEEFLPEVKRRGFTELHCFDGFGPEGRKELELVAEFSDDELKLVPVPGFEYIDFAREHGCKFLGGDFWLDGSITAGTAAISGWDTELYHSDETVSERMLTALEGGFTPTVHAIGDRAVEQALCCYAKARGQTKKQSAGLRIEHASAITEEQLHRCRDEGVTLSMQPGFNRMFGKQYAEALGEDRAARLNPVKRALELGCEVLMGSDAFVTPMRKDWIYPEEIRELLPAEKGI